MLLTITSVIMALQLVSASVLPRSGGVDYSALEGVEPFNMTFAEAHLVQLDGSVLDDPSVPASEISSRAPSGNVYYCINAGWQPACEVRHMPNDVCQEFRNPWEDTISSWGPDPGVTCHLYEKRNCDEGGHKIYNVKNPGIANLGDFQLNDAISSARCWYW